MRAARPATRTCRSRSCRGCRRPPRPRSATMHWLPRSPSRSTWSSCWTRSSSCWPRPGAGRAARSPSRPTVVSLRRLAGQPDLSGDAALGLEHGGDVLVQVHPQDLQALDDVLAQDAAGEVLVLELLL